MDQTLKDIFDNSDKAEIIEELGEVLNTEGCKVAIITGIPKPDGGLNMHVIQAGHKYVYELLGFLSEGMDILQAPSGEKDEA